MSHDCRPDPEVTEALRVLGVRNLVLGMHDLSFPSSDVDDTGRGTPCSPAGAAVVAFLRRAGFDGLQLGPQGLTAADDPSPYTGTLFSRDPLSVSLARLADPEGEWHGLLPARELAALVARRPDDAADRVPHDTVHPGHRRALARAEECLRKRVQDGDGDARDVDRRLRAFCRDEAAWLEGDAVYEVLRARYGDRDFEAWEGPEADLDRRLGGALDARGAAANRCEAIRRRHAAALSVYRFTQFVAHAQHARFREESNRIGVRLYGDFQVGVSPRDAWRHPDCFLPGYYLGAPPSRTNPDGQPWRYPVLDPDRYLDDGAPGKAMAFLTRRVEKSFDAYDALRLDHPQGLVCPWVYRADDADAMRAVQEGARLFSSPNLPDHPALARYAIPTVAQLDPSLQTPRYADRRILTLRPEQIDRYAILVDRVVEVARRHVPEGLVLVCEILSTLPFPLACVLERHGLGRFRVSQKVDPRDAADVYRPENARAQDWVMFGNHDTPSLWQLLERWPAERIAERARAAAHVLAPPASASAAREALARELAARPDRLAHAEIARLLASPAENVLVFFSDLFGVASAYNEPGTVGSHNWAIRLPRDWRARHDERVRRGRALDLRLALALALRARPGGEDLAARLERLAGGWPSPG